ncbi:MAG: VOC family protein [Microvirga sp.]|nr:VOC family protein [Microvirga sp.]
MTGLSHMTFVVKDLDAMARFLCDGLGAREIYDSGERCFSLSREKFFDLAGLWIVAMEGDAPIAPSYRHIAFSAPREALPELETRLRALGVTFREARGRVEGEGDSVYVYDFEGHLFEIHAGERDERLARYAQPPSSAGR